MRSRVRHNMKIWPEFFAATKRGHKKFELRQDDRPEGFQVGDELLLKEWDPESEEVPTPLGVSYSRTRGYTGREVLVRVDYIMSADMVCKIIHPLINPDDMDKFVIMSVSLLP